MTISLSFLLLAQVATVQSYEHETRPRSVIKSVTATCSDAHSFTFTVDLVKLDSRLAVMHNGAQVVIRAPEALIKRLGKRRIIGSEPLECLGVGGSDGSSWILTTYDPREMDKTGKAFVRLAKNNAGWDLVVDDVSDPA